MTVASSSLAIDLAERQQDVVDLEERTWLTRHCRGDASAFPALLEAYRRPVFSYLVRSGVAEADRSAAESVLTKKQERDAAIVAIRSSFTAEEGEILLTPAGEVVMQVYGISFGVGSSALKAGQDDLVEKIVAAIQMFPARSATIELT